MRFKKNGSSIASLLRQQQLLVKKKRFAQKTKEFGGT